MASESRKRLFGGGVCETLSSQPGATSDRPVGDDRLGDISGRRNGFQLPPISLKLKETESEKTEMETKTEAELKLREETSETDAESTFKFGTKTDF